MASDIAAIDTAGDKTPPNPIPAGATPVKMSGGMGANRENAEMASPTPSAALAAVAAPTGGYSAPACAAADDDLPGTASGDLFSPRSRHEMASVFQPVLRSFMLPIAVFYVVVIVPDFLWSPFATALAMSIQALGTAAVALLCHRHLRRRDVGFGALELIGGLILVLIYANCCKLLAVDFKPPNLTYFLILLIVTAAIAISIRLIVAICTLALVTMLAAAYAMGLETLTYYAFASLAAAVAAAGTAISTRMAVLGALRARATAEHLRHNAEEQAGCDPLTGLPNRLRFAAILHEAAGDGTNLHVAAVGLERFALVKDLYGYSLGDALVLEASRRILSCCAPEDKLVRLATAEFALVIPRPLDAQALSRLGRSICDVLHAPFDLSGTSVSVTASIGFSHYPTDAENPLRVYEQASHALYRAKRSARGGMVVFSPEHERERRRIVELEQAIRNADFDREISVVFQPQYDMTGGRTDGFEALARWQSPVLGAVSPAEFVSVAERAGLMEQLTAAVLRKALAEAVAWPDHIGLSVNLSALDLMSRSSMDNIVKAVESGTIAAHRLVFEITETVMMRDFLHVRDVLFKLADLGCRIALDDFGSGYSSFAYIHRFPLHRVKTDRSFVLRLKDEEEIGRGILKTIADLCANLGVECLAEGVETERDLRLVEEAGVRRIQGYYFGRPMQASEIPGYLASEGRFAKGAAGRA
jgi:diguanylate cyclase (GGDEF)-like protein